MDKAPRALVGRLSESQKIKACLQARRNILLEGPVGVGKTHLALSVIHELGLPAFRVDGDNRYTEQKLSGWFDPPAVMKKGYIEEAFFPGPLTQAMRAGGVLFINELNRLPEGVQNVLLPAIDEQILEIPKIGTIRAKPGFLVVATQNPKEFVATSHLSEALLDRFELIMLDYQTEAEELQIVQNQMAAASEKTDSKLLECAVKLIRHTRDHARIKRGVSVRAALSIAELGRILMNSGASFEEAFLRAAFLALPTRIEIQSEADTGLTPQKEMEQLIQRLVQEVLDSALKQTEIKSADVKKKT